MAVCSCFSILQFPIGIDSDRFIRALELPKVRDHINELKQRFEGRKVLASAYILLNFKKLFIQLDVTCFMNINWIRNSLPSMIHFIFQVMLGVDRLDMIKGIPQKILAFEKFLEENPNWREKVVLLQIAVPTRTDVPECMFS